MTIKKPENDPDFDVLEYMRSISPIHNKKYECATVADWTACYLTHYCTGIKESTKLEYKKIIDQHINRVLGKVILTDLTHEDVQLFVNSLNIGIEIEKELSPKSVKNEIDGAAGQTIETQYMETAQAKLDYMDSIPEQLFITWEDNKMIPPDECVEYQATADEKRVEIAGTTEFGSPVGIPDEACFLVRSEEDYQAMTALYPNIDCGFAESDEYDALFLLIPIEDADTYVSVTGITVSEATGRISLFIADDSYAYRDLETFSATKIVRLYIEKDALLPEFSGEFPQKVGMNVTWDYENTYDDLTAFCEAYPAATYIEVVS